MEFNRRPRVVYRAMDYQANDGEEKTSYTRVGAAFPHKKGCGFNIEITEGILLSGQLVALPPRPLIKLHQLFDNKARSILCPSGLLVSLRAAWRGFRGLDGPSWNLADATLRHRWTQTVLTQGRSSGCVERPAHALAASAIGIDAARAEGIAMLFLTK